MAKAPTPIRTNGPGIKQTPEPDHDHEESSDHELHMKAQQVTSLLQVSYELMLALHGSEDHEVHDAACTALSSIDDALEDADIIIRALHPELYEDEDPTDG